MTDEDLKRRMAALAEQLHETAEAMERLGKVVEGVREKLDRVCEHNDLWDGT